MIFEWDENKNEINIKKHGFPFAFAEYVLSDKKRTEIVDGRKDYGEKRFLTWGIVGKRCFCVCYTVRDNAFRIISLRPVHKKEKELYYDNYQNK